MKLQLKRSSILENGAAKQPEPVQLEYGELAVNYNTADPTLFFKDSANAIVKVGANDYLSLNGGTLTGDLGVTGNVTAVEFIGSGDASFDGTVSAAAFDIEALPALP